MKRPFADCGACYAFSAVAAVEFHSKLITKKNLMGSEQDIIDCDLFSFGCDGKKFEFALSQFHETFNFYLNCRRLADKSVAGRITFACIFVAYNLIHSMHETSEYPTDMPTNTQTLARCV